jgi:MoaA/NifB/PqqE/SkfB family radical SAM enzyme
MKRLQQQTIKLPEMICFRVTRHCNARCRFCLAPPEGEQPDAATLKGRIDWLLAHGVKTIHFCGGEPTIHPALGELIAYVQSRGGKSRLTTNAIAIPDALLPLLRTTATEVKVSLHGDHDHHNAIVGVTAFKHTTRNIKRLIAAGVNTSIQSTLVAGQIGVIDWLTRFCLEAGVRRLSILPFIPRGNGLNCSDEFALTPLKRRELRDQIKKRRHTLTGKLDLRWLDFSAQPLHVVEADGRVVLEAATEARDELVCRIPGSTIEMS